MPYKKPNNFNVDRRIPITEGFTEKLRSESIVSRHYRLFFTPSKRAFARLGIVVSKRILNKAKDRNAHKRLIREAFRIHAIKTQKLDLIVMVRQFGKASANDRSVELSELFSKLGFQCEQS